MALKDIIGAVNPVKIGIEAVNTIKGVFDEFNFSEEEKQKAMEALKKIEGAVAVADATGHSTIQRTARPATIYMWNGTLVTLIWINYIITPVLAWFGHEAIYAPIPDMVWMFTGAVSGLSNVTYFIARTWEKNGGVGRWQK